MSKPQNVSKDQLLVAFKELCRAYKVVSAGFDPKAITAPIDGDKHDGLERWAISYTRRLGYMIVCGWGGCGLRFGRWDGYIRNRWDFLMLLEILWWEKARSKRLQNEQSLK